MFLLSQTFLLFKCNHVMLFCKPSPGLVAEPVNKKTAQKLKFRQNSTPDLHKNLNNEKQTTKNLIVYFRPKNLKKH